MWYECPRNGTRRTNLQILASIYSRFVLCVRLIYILTKNIFLSLVFFSRKKTKIINEKNMVFVGVVCVAALFKSITMIYHYGFFTIWEKKVEHLFKNIIFFLLYLYYNLLRFYCSKSQNFFCNYSLIIKKITTQNFCFISETKNLT